MAHELNPAQAQAVRTRHNVVVSAGAGSGKTRVLSTRYVDLVVNDGVPVRRILTLTFTRKAAGEMFARIHADLTRAGEEHPFAREQLADMERASISTLDGFAGEVVRDAGSMFGLSPEFVVDPVEFERRVLRFVEAFAAGLAPDSALARIAARFGRSRIVDDLLVPLCADVFRLSRELDLPGISAAWHAHLLGERDASAARIREAAERMVASALDTTKVRAVKESLSAALAGGDLLAVAGVIEGINRAIAGVKTPEGVEFRAALDSVHPRARRDAPTARYREAVATLARFEEVSAAYDELASLQQSFRASLRRDGVLGYTDVMELAVRVLRENPEVRSAYKRRFDHIMIDEFQDTNETQRDLLFLLAERADRTTPGVPAAPDLDPRKLFFVGDQKQSIYRFRGADVSVFKRLADDVADSLPGTEAPVIELPTNYRSEPALIRFFNALFSRVFAPEGDRFGSSAEFEAEFERLAVPEGRDSDLRPRATIASVESSDDEDALVDHHAEAEWIANKIEAMMANASAADERFEYDDFAILLSAGSNQQKYERILRRRGIPYTGQSVRSLFLDAPANDLTWMLQLALVPEDRYAYAVVLRSPFAALSDSGIATVLSRENDAFTFAGDGGGDRSGGYGKLTAADLDRYRAARAVYRRVVEMIDTTPLLDVLSYLWTDAGYRESVLWRPHYHSYLQHFDYIAMIAKRFEGRPAIEFVDYMIERLGTAEKLKDTEDIAGGRGVRIMTIHAAKGLEFPVVFVADMGRVDRSRDQRLYTFDGGEMLTITVPPRDPTAEEHLGVFTRVADALDRAMDRAERKRLLYVAATRARKYLFLSRPHAGQTPREPGLSFQSLIDHSVDFADRDFDGLVRFETIPPMPRDELLRVSTRVDERNPEDAFRHLSTPGRSVVISRQPRETDLSPAVLDAVRWSRSGTEARGGTEEADEPGIPGIEQSRNATAFGALVHEILERRILGSLTRGECTLDVPWLPGVYQGVPGTEVERAIADAWKLADAFLVGTFWRGIVGAAGTEEHPRAGTEERAPVETEVPFVWFMESIGMYVRGRIDAIVNRDDEVVVIDFKTDTEIRPDDHVVQTAVYRYAAEHIYGKPAVVYLAYLRHDVVIRTEHSVDKIDWHALVGDAVASMVPSEP